MIYELLYILSPKFTDEEAKKTHKKILESLKPFITRVNLEEFWGKKQLAYEIKHFQNGYFVLVIFETESKKISEIDKKLKLQEEILRFLLVRQEYEYIKVKPSRPKVVFKKGLKIEKEEIRPTKEKKPLSPGELDKKLDEILGGEIVK
ncbi:MAG: 30S ribosomal protein S6 [Patescibacteria group bacterium]